MSQVFCSYSWTFEYSSQFYKEWLNIPTYRWKDSHFGRDDSNTSGATIRCSVLQVRQWKWLSVGLLFLLVGHPENLWNFGTCVFFFSRIRLEKLKIPKWLGVHGWFGLFVYRFVCLLFVGKDLASSCNLFCFFFGGDSRHQDVIISCCLFFVGCCQQSEPPTPSVKQCETCKNTK